MGKPKDVQAAKVGERIIIGVILARLIKTA